MIGVGVCFLTPTHQIWLGVLLRRLFYANVLGPHCIASSTAPLAYAYGDYNDDGGDGLLVCLPFWLPMILLGHYLDLRSLQLQVTHTCPTRQTFLWLATTL